MALLRVGDILIQRHTDALGDSALGLNSRQIRIDNGSAVNKYPLIISKTYIYYRTFNNALLSPTKPQPHKS